MKQRVREVQNTPVGYKAQLLYQIQHSMFLSQQTRMPHLWSVFLLITLGCSCVRGKAKVKAGWTEFTIRISCAIESLLPDGEYDQEANKSCVDCFGQLAIVPPWEGSDIVRSCSSTHLPNIREHCNSELEQETIFRKLWIESKKCFNDYVKKNWN